MKKLSILSLVAALLLCWLSAAAETGINSAVDARNGVVRILTTDDTSDPGWFATGSGFGVGTIGRKTDIFVTNRHVVFDDEAGRVADCVYIMLDDNAAKRVYSSFGGFYDAEAGAAFKLRLDPDHMVRCEVLYPRDGDPAYPDLAILRAERKVDGRVALPLLSADAVQDTSAVWTIGYPGSADKLYNMDSVWEEMKYEADVDGAQLFSGYISRRGSMKSLGGTKALTHGAQIDHGNSGGPLVTEAGQVIGINTYGFESAETTSVGYYLSIYADYAMAQLDALGLPYNVQPTAEDEADAPAQQDIREGAGEPAPEATAGTKVVSLETGHTDYNDDGTVKVIVKKAYNAYGDLVRLDSYDSNGVLDHTYLDEYDERGNKILERTLDGSGKETSRVEYRFDEEGRGLGYYEYDENGDLEHWNEYLYDEDGVRIGDLSHYSDGDETNVRYYYNSDGTLRKRVQSHGDGEVISNVEYEYDAAGNQIAKLELNGDGSLKRLNEYTYDENSLEIGYASYDADGLRYWVEYTYDDAGRKLTDTMFDEDGTLRSYEARVYDAYGNAVSDVTYEPDGSVKSESTYERAYDADGNMVSSVYLRDGVVRTEIQYAPVEVLVRPER